MSLLKNFDSRSRKIISSIVNMSKILEIHTLSEGIETEEQLTFLRDIGCEIIQGYYFSKPLCESDFLAYLQTHETESIAEHDFWNEAGKVNLLSSDPLMSFSGLSDPGNSKSFRAAPFAFIEYDEGRISYPYMNDAYKDEIRKVGFHSVSQVESAVNDTNYEYYDRFVRQIRRTISRRTIQRIDGIMGGVLYTLTTKLVTSSGNRHLIASSAHVISSEKNDRLVLKYSQSLYATYDLVTEITPDRDSSVQIFSNAGFAKVYGTVSLRNGISEFAAAEVHPEDRERYLEFFDLDTLKERVQVFIQQSFRVSCQDGYEEKSIRISNLRNGKYLYTIQSV